MTFAWIEEREGTWPVARLCEVLAVSRAGFYAWRSRGMSATAARRVGLAAGVETTHGEVRDRYGTPRIHAELRSRGHECCVNTVARVMREASIAAKPRRPFRRTTDSSHAMPVADNVLDRQFDPPESNAAWVADVTYIPTREGWLYVAVVIDLFSRLVVGWSMDATMTSRLVLDAFGMAVALRRPGAGLVAYSDRGSQYAGEHHRRVLAGAACSMRRRGNCWDNVPAESFFASLKKELVHGEDYATRDEARASILEYVEVFYNRVRRHSTLGYLTPAEYERARNPTHRQTLPQNVGNSTFCTGYADLAALRSA